MTPAELLAIANRLLYACRDPVTGEPLYAGVSADACVEDVEAAARYLRACADALDAGPWAVLADGTTLYPLATPAPLRLPELMTDEAIYENDAIMAANSLAGLLFGDFATVVRAIEAEVLRRVKEANE